MFRNTFYLINLADHYCLKKEWEMVLFLLVISNQDIFINMYIIYTISDIYRGMTHRKRDIYFKNSLCYINNTVSCHLYFGLLYILSFVRSVAKRSVWCLFAIAQPIVLSLRNNETYGPQLYLEENVSMRAVAERLILAPST